MRCWIVRRYISSTSRHEREAACLRRRLVRHSWRKFSFQLHCSRSSSKHSHFNTEGRVLSYLHLQRKSDYNGHFFLQYAANCGPLTGSFSFSIYSCAHNSFHLHFPISNYRHWLVRIHRKYWLELYCISTAGFRHYNRQRPFNFAVD